MYIGYPLVVSRYVKDKIISKHGITIDEVEKAVRKPSNYVRRGRGVEIYEILTSSHYGKYMLIVLRKLSGTNYKLITARLMTARERRYYAAKKR